MKGCKFCNTDEWLLENRKLGRYSDSRVGINVYLDRYDNTININAGHESNSGCSCYQEDMFEINYCPMCGTKL